MLPLNMLVLNQRVLILGLRYLATSNNRKFPVYDGTQYHFMPWSRTKPTVILHSEWEDADYRVGALNILIWMRDFMVTAVFSFWDFV